LLSLPSFTERKGNLRQIPSDNPKVADRGSPTKYSMRYEKT
jgi:hypothetical protein